MDKLLTPKQLSELLQVNLSTVYKWVHYHYIPSVKLGASVRFREKRVEKWLQGREKRGRSSYKIQIED